MKSWGRKTARALKERQRERESVVCSTEVEMCGWTSLFGDGMMVIQLAHGNHGDLGICGDVISMMGSQVKTGV